MINLDFLMPIFYQIININQTQPCFFNTTAGAEMWKNCGITTDPIKTALLPFQWVTGGYFSMILVSVLVMSTYIKYHKAVYPLLIGTIFLPISFTVFPEVFLMWAIIFAGFTIGIIVWWVFVSQSSET